MSEPRQPPQRPAGRSDGGDRVDRVLVDRGMARSRAIARGYVEAGRVRLDGRTVRKPSEPVAGDARLEVVGEPEPWVGRAAYKLLAALDAFGPRGLTVHGRRCLDVGASTGGFTQVLLSRGALEVTALDVGHGQLATVVREDPRVRERSGTSVRDVGPNDLGGTFEVVVGDLSFISLRLVLAPIASLLAPAGDLVLLVKPQFEVGREALGRHGVVQSIQQQHQSVHAVLRVGRDHGLSPVGLVPSPITGSTGNQEYLLWLTSRTDGMMNAMEITEALGGTGR